MKLTRITRTLAVAAAASLALVTAPVVASAVPATNDAQAEDFSIAVLPDTQYNSKFFPDVWDSTGKWLAKEKDNIEYVLHEGDIINDSDQADQWTAAVNGMDYLHNAIPYLLNVGNHDMDDQDKRTTTQFNKHFPLDKYKDWPTFGGSFPEGKHDNAYHTFAAGGTNWLAISLAFEPGAEELEWANKVVADHPDHQVMVVTHSYQKGDQRTETGDGIWNEFVKKHENISFVFSGHHVAAGMIEEEGDNGNTVYQIQADYQDPDNKDPNTYLRHMTFSPANKTVEVKTYSPHLDKYMDDADNQFTIKNFEFMPAK